MPLDVAQEAIVGQSLSNRCLIVVESLSRSRPIVGAETTIFLPSGDRPRSAPVLL